MLLLEIIMLMFYRKPEAPNSVELHRGFGYVEFEDPDDVKDAIDNMDQSELFGKVIKVSAAKAPKNVNEGLGSKTALWEQVGFDTFLGNLSTLILIFIAGRLVGRECC